MTKRVERAVPQHCSWPSTRIAAVFALAHVLAPVAARAEGTGDLEELLDEPLVETASKSTESVSTAPAITTIITAEDLRRYGVTSLDKAINLFAVGMESEAPLTAPEIGAQGVLISQDYGAHVLVLVDGHALNEVWGGTAYFDRGLGVPMELVDHIELILGPGSVLYGSNAMLGVINIVTKHAKDWRGLHLVTEAEIFPTSEGAPGFSLRAGAGVARDFKLFKEPSEFVFHAEYFTQDGPSLRFGPQDYGNDSVTGAPRVFSDQTPPGVWGGVARDAYFNRIPSGYAKLAIGDFRVSARASLFDRALPYHGGDFDDPTNDERDRWLSLDVGYRRALDKRFELSARLYGDLYDYRQRYPSKAPEDCLDGQDAGCLYYLDGVARWGGLELDTSLDWMADGRMVTLLGADGRVKSIGSTTDILALGTAAAEDPPSLDPLNAYEETEFAIGVYLQQTMNPAKWIGFNIGARIDADERYGVHVSPRGAATVSPWKGASFKGIVATAFRAPTAFESYYADPTSQLLPEGLRPETERSITGAFEQRFGTHTVEVSIFQTAWQDLVLTQDLTDQEIQDAIDRGQLDDSVTYAQQTRNVSKIDSFGITLRAEGSALQGRLRYGGSVTRARARRYEPDSDVPLELGAAASIHGNARVSYDFAEGKPVVALAGYFTGPRPVNSGEDGVEAPLQVALRGTVSGPIKPLKGITYRVSGAYAFADRFAYTVGPATLGDGAPELAPVPQLSFSVGLGYDFDWSEGRERRGD